MIETSIWTRVQTAYADARIPYQRDDAGNAIFPPRGPIGTEGKPHAWQVSSGLGFVYATTTIHALDQEDRDLSVIELAEGFRMVSAVIGIPPEDVHIGMPVRVHFDESSVPYFEPR